MKSKERAFAACKLRVFKEVYRLLSGNCCPASFEPAWFEKALVDHSYLSLAYKGRITIPILTTAINYLEPHRL
jgi:hypothetical protein